MAAAPAQRRVVTTQVIRDLQWGPGERTSRGLALPYLSAFRGRAHHRTMLDKPGVLLLICGYGQSPRPSSLLATMTSSGQGTRPCQATDTPLRTADGRPHVRTLPPARTLDVACGSGFLTRHLQGVTVGLDQSRAMVALTQSRLPNGVALIGSALDLPLADGVFDRVVTGHFYGHLAPDERRDFLTEARRVAREVIVIDSARELYRHRLRATSRRPG
jgi:SAM-dependent methyltransferase